MASHKGSSGRSGRRGGFPRSQPFRREPSLPPPSEQQKRIQDIGIEEVLGEFRFKAESKPQIRDVSYLASYNWVDSAAATICVPGEPPTWLPPAGSQKLQPDGGVYLRDPNSARYPGFPLEPAVQAVLIQDPAFETSCIDIFGCGNTLGSLLAFSRNEKRTFRFGADCIGNTVFLVRKTNTPGETIQEVRGYGHTFPERYTTWDSEVRGSASCQRIIRYDFMGVKCVIRSECDGFLPDLIPDPSTTLHHKVEHSIRTTNLLDSKILPLNIGLQAPMPSGKLSIRCAGRRIPQAAIFDLKTRSIRSRDQSKVSMDEFYPRLWANQTPNFILAFHDRGTFDPTNIDVKPVRAKVKEWEADNTEVLKIFGALLTKLIGIARTRSPSQFEIRRKEMGHLELWSEVLEWRALPEEMRSRWENSGADVHLSKEHDADEDEKVSVVASEGER